MYDLRILLIWLVLGFLLYLIANRPERETDNKPESKTTIREKRVNADQAVTDRLAEMDFVEKFDFKTYIPSRKSREIIPERIMLDLSIVPLRIDDEVLVLAMVNPFDLETIDIVREITGREVKPILISRKELIAVVGNQ